MSIWASAKWRIFIAFWPHLCSQRRERRCEPYSLWLNSKVLQSLCGWYPLGMNGQRGAVIFYGKVGFASHVICLPPPVEGFLQHRLGNGFIQSGIGEVDYIRKAVSVVISLIRPCL